MDNFEGIILKEQAYGESSKILQLLTKDGIIGVMAKGCRNLKNVNRSATTKLTFGNFYLYYKKDKLSTLKSVDILNPFKQIKKDLTKISFAMYLLDLTYQVVRQNQNEQIYNILKNALLKIEEGMDALVITSIVEIKYLAFLGVMPILDCCSVCGSTSGITTLPATRGGYVCKKCINNDPIVSEKSIKLLRMYYYVDLEKISKTDVKEDVKLEINSFLEQYYEKYTGLYLKSKKFLKDLNKINS